MQVRHARHRAELLEHEEDDAVVQQAAPVAPANQVPLFVGQSGRLEARLGIGHEGFPMRRLDHAVQVVVDPIGPHGDFDRERIRAFELLDIRQLNRHPLPVTLDDRRLRLSLFAFVDGGRDACHRRQVVAAVLAHDVVRQRAAHRQPHHDFRAFVAAQFRVFGDRHVGELLGVALEEIEKALVPFRVVEAGALAMHLMRQATGREDRDLEVLRIAFDCAPQCLAELIEASRTRDRQLQHAHLQRHEFDGPLRLVRTQHRQRRKAAVIEGLVLEEGHVELIGHQRRPDVRGQRRMPFDRRQVASATALVRDVPLRPDAQRERRIVVEEERGDVIVVDRQDHVRFLLGEPVGHRGEVLEDGCPDGVVALVLVERKADGGRVRGGDASNDPCHACTPSKIFLIRDTSVLRLTGAAALRSHEARASQSARRAGSAPKPFTPPERRPCGNHDCLTGWLDRPS